MEVAPFFVDFHHFLSIFTIFYRFSRFMHFCRDLHFVAIYALFPQIFLVKIAFPATSHVFCMYDVTHPPPHSYSNCAKDSYKWSTKIVKNQVLTDLQKFYVWSKFSKYVFSFVVNFDVYEKIEISIDFIITIWKSFFPLTDFLILAP